MTAGEGVNSFPTTHWTQVLRAGESLTSDGQHALDSLLRRYLPAFRTHLLAKWRLTKDEADDVLQAFITRKFLEKCLPAQADRARGRFRSFALTALDNFTISHLRQELAEKRHLEHGIAGMFELPEQTGREQSPSRTFDVAWAKQVIADAIDAMREECTQSRREDVWGIFEARVVNPILNGASALDYGELVSRFSIPTPAAASNLLMTGKRMFARHLRAIVAEYSDSPETVSAELTELRKILSGAGSP